jgi:hypothetical protein
MSLLHTILFTVAAFALLAGAAAAQNVTDCPPATTEPAVDELQIPCFIGMTVAQATLAAIDNDLVSEYLNDPACVGTELVIVSQLPASGTIAKKVGAKVVLFTTTSVVVPDPSTFGNPASMSPEQVQASLTISGFSAHIRETFGDIPFCYEKTGDVRMFSNVEPKPGAPICRNQSIAVIAYNDPILQSQWHCDKRGFNCICP